MQEKLDTNKLIFRQMTVDELRQAIQRQNTDDWFLCENEAEAIYSVDPKGFFVAEHEGQVVATLVIINYGDGFKYGCMYTVLKEFRGMGVGPPLFEYGVKQANFENPEECSLGQAEHHIWPIYNKRKWQIFCNEVAYKFTAKSHSEISGVVNLKTIPIEKLYEYDLKAFGYKRESYLKLLLGHEEHFGCAKLDNEGRILGFAILKKLKDGFYKLAPWFAEDKRTATDLFKSIQNYVVGDEIQVKILDINEEAAAIVQENNCEKVFSEYRIYMHKMPEKMDSQRCFGIGGDFS